MFLRFLNIHVFDYSDLFRYLIGTPPASRPPIPSNQSSDPGTAPNATQPAPSANPPVAVTAPDSRPPLYALIIGIDNYRFLRKLRGAVADADAVKEYLEKDLKVPSNQIRNLRDTEATRSAIIKAFYELRDDPRIKKDDPILIYYAGHGSELPAPPGWEAGGEGSKIQLLDPQDYCKADTNEIHAIPDRTIGALINGIAQNKGNNITVIFDCCHSASGSREDDQESSVIVRGVELKDNLPTDLDQDVWGDGRGADIAAGFTHIGLRSHVILAACSANETAKEGGGRGFFTEALLTLLKSVGADKLAYSEVLTRMDKIATQNPQCEGFYQDRIFFDAKAPTPGRVCYPVRFEDGKYTMDAGSAHGITQDSEFTVYQNRDSLLTTSPLGVLIASEIGPFSTTMTLPPGKPDIQLTQQALALQTKLGAEEDLLLHVPMDEKLINVFDALVLQMQGIGPDACKISLVDRDKAKLEIVMENDELVFNILDWRVTQYGLTRIPHTVPATVDDISYVLRAAAHYFWHLNRSQPNNLIQNKIQIEFTKLEKSKSEFDEAGRSLLLPVGPNLCRDGVVDFFAHPKDIYGIKIINNTPWDLYPSVFFFDSSDLSIKSYYQPPKATQYKLDVPLKEKVGTLTIGYGSGGAVPYSYTVSQKGGVDVGFLKFFFSTKPVDLAKIPQPTPFVGRRTANPVEKEIVETWGTTLIPVVYRKSV